MDSCLFRSSYRQDPLAKDVLVYTNIPGFAREALGCPSTDEGDWKKNGLANRLLNLVRERGGSVSFADLTLNVDGFKSDDPERSFELSYPHWKNIVIWYGLSEAGSNAVAELLREFKIIIRPVALFIYAIDGMIPGMPVAKRPRVYQKTHWLPMVIYLDKREPSLPREPGTPH